LRAGPDPELVATGRPIENWEDLCRARTCRHGKIKAFKVMERGVVALARATSPATASSASTDRVLRQEAARRHLKQIEEARSATTA
jgi:hypothetical protein